MAAEKKKQEQFTSASLLELLQTDRTRKALYIGKNARRKKSESNTYLDHSRH